MNFLFFLCFVAALVGSSTSQRAEARDSGKEKIFRLHLNQEPQSLDPQKQTSAVSNYLIQTLHRNFFWYDNKKGLIPDLGESCQRKKSKLLCTLKKNLRWSTGAPLKAQDFLEAYKFLLSNSQGALHAKALFSLKKAQLIFKGEAPLESLGVKVLNDRELEFDFEEENPEFEHYLAQSALSPRPPDEKSFSGPYKLKEWKKSQALVLEPNGNYPRGNPLRPDVEFLFLLEDSVALKFYEKGDLHFLRRLPTTLLNTWKDKPDFKSFEILRFDYFGISPELKEEKLRKALILSLNSYELQKIFQSVGRPGCSSLPEEFFSPGKLPCLEPSPSEAQKISLGLKWPEDLVFSYSTQGGEDHRRVAEWMQNQWKTQLKLNFRVQSLENKVFLEKMKANPSTVFRKGITLDRPSCLAALEVFSSEHPENYIRYHDENYEKIVQKMKGTRQEKKKKELCRQGVEWLFQHFLFYPTGRFDFFTLIQPEVENLELNRMNQLDLSQIQFKNPK